MRAAKALARFNGCSGLSEPWLLENALSTKYIYVRYYHDAANTSFDLLRTCNLHFQ